MQADTSPDPVQDPTGYTEMVLGYLADDDPLQAQAGTPETLRALVAEAGDHLRTHPGPNEWSALECIAHIVDAEIVSTGRYRWILAQDEPPLPAYDQDRWMDRLGQKEGDPDELLSLFEALRRANLALWSRSSAADRARVGIHDERGRESFDRCFRLIAGHDRLHLDQARRALSAVRTPGPQA